MFRTFAARRDVTQHICVQCACPRRSHQTVHHASGSASSIWFKVRRFADCSFGSSTQSKRESPYLHKSEQTARDIIQNGKYTSICLITNIHTAHTHTPRTKVLLRAHARTNNRNRPYSTAAICLRTNTQRMCRHIAVICSFKLLTLYKEFIDPPHTHARI